MHDTHRKKEKRVTKNRPQTSIDIISGDVLYGNKINKIKKKSNSKRKRD